MATKTKKSKKSESETDSVYFLKLTLFLIMCSLWFKISDGAGTFQLPIPIGLCLGILFASHEHFQIDRKIEYAVLILAAFIGFWAPFGIYALI